jgi:hypothetical protein
MYCFANYDVTSKKKCEYSYTGAKKGAPKQLVETQFLHLLGYYAAQVAF